MSLFVMIFLLSDLYLVLHFPIQLKAARLVSELRKALNDVDCYL